jgi:hypothetical protein
MTVKSFMVDVKLYDTSTHPDLRQLTIQNCGVGSWHGMCQTCSKSLMPLTETLMVNYMSICLEFMSAKEVAVASSCKTTRLD